MDKKYFIGGVMAVIALFFVFTSQPAPRAENALGSVGIASEYQSTTTSQGRFLTGTTRLCSSQGALGSVIMTGPTSGVMQFFNATTSSISQRISTMSSSSILLADLTNYSATTTQTFDLIATNGLLVDIQGTVPTSTITYRCF